MVISVTPAMSAILLFSIFSPTDSHARYIAAAATPFEFFPKAVPFPIAFSVISTAFDCALSDKFKSSQIRGIYISGETGSRLIFNCLVISLKARLNLSGPIPAASVYLANHMLLYFCGMQYKDRLL